MAVSVTDLSVARGGVPLLEAVSFTVAAGEALILRGPNGAGKTTLLRTLAGLQPPLSGRIGVADDAVAFAGHADGVKSALSVTENLDFWASIFGVTDISPALEAFDLAALAPRRAGLLSAGQKRRVGLARLVLTGRPVWLLDEPTVSLDARAVASLMRCLARHLAAGGSAVIASHTDLDLSPARPLDLSGYRARDPAPDRFDEAYS
ncbi:MAG: heme ABC exporter ATP-binding protein CcmA [Pseudomonadota bacterium]